MTVRFVHFASLIPRYVPSRSTTILYILIAPVVCCGINKLYFHFTCWSFYFVFLRYFARREIRKSSRRNVIAKLRASKLQQKFLRYIRRNELEAQIFLLMQRKVSFFFLSTHQPALIRRLKHIYISSSSLFRAFSFFFFFKFLYFPERRPGASSCFLFGTCSQYFQI